MPAPDDRGSVTAEAAVVLPVLALVAVGLTWLLSVAGSHLRATDAAREAARVAARGESVASAEALGRRVAPAGASVLLVRGRGLWVATVVAPVNGPGGILRGVTGVTVRARAVAAVEPGG